MTPRRAKFRFPKGATLNGRSVGGRYASDGQLKAWRRTERETKRERGDVVPWEDDDAAVEWEIGIDYNTAGGRSDVDVNVRLRRTDGSKMTFAEARDTWGHYQTMGTTPPDYVIASIDWRNPKKGTRWSHGSDDDVMNLSGPLYVADQVSAKVHHGELRHETTWRFGSVKGSGYHRRGK